MPIYEYSCECGQRLEAIEKMGAVRERCGELCCGQVIESMKGNGKVERLFSSGLLRGDGREAVEPSFDPCKRSGRPGGGCDDF